MDPNEYNEDWSKLNIDWSQYEEPEVEEVVDGLYTEEVAQQVLAENRTKPDPRVSYTPLVWEKFYQCPYNQSHLVNQEKLQTHLNKCKIQYELRYKPGNRPGNIQVCKFNRNHHHPASEMEMHQELCPNQGPTFDFKAHAPHMIFGNTGIEPQAGSSSAAMSTPDFSGQGSVRDTLEPAGAFESTDPGKNEAPEYFPQNIPNAEPINRHAAAAAIFQRIADMEPEAPFNFNVPQFPTPGHVNLTDGQISSEPPRPLVPSTLAQNVVEEDWDLEAAMHPPRPNFAYNPIQTFMDNPHLLLPVPPGLPRNVRRALRTARNEARRAMDENNAERRAQVTADRGVHQPGQFEAAEIVQVDPPHDFHPDAPEAPDFPY